jgi:hypothetical protein
LPLTITASQPLLVYEKQSGNQWYLNLLTADGLKKFTRPLPPGGFIPDLQSALSPDGQWLAFYNGNVEPQTIAAGFPGLNLNLLRLSDGEVLPISNLLSRDYPENFVDAAENYLRRNLDVDTELPEVIGWFKRSFLAGIYSLAWTPDSQSLAFAGQMDGMTSDMYLYKMASAEIQRLERGADNIQWLTWSPDGARLLYASADLPAFGEERRFQVLALESGTVTLFDELGACSGNFEFIGWAADAVHRFYCSELLGKRMFREINVETGELVDIFADYFDSFAEEPLSDNLLMAVSRSPNPLDQSRFVAGLYNFDPLTKQSELVTTGIFRQVIYWGTPTIEYLASSVRGVFAIGPGGVVFAISDVPYKEMVVSPDREWLLLFDAPAEPGFEIRTTDGYLLHREEGENVDVAAWRLDSKGFYYRSGSELFFFSDPDELPFPAIEDLLEIEETLTLTAVVSATEIVLSATVTPEVGDEATPDPSDQQSPTPAVEATLEPTEVPTATPEPTPEPINEILPIMIDGSLPRVGDKAFVWIP